METTTSKAARAEMVSGRDSATLRCGAAALAFGSRLVHPWVFQRQFLIRPLVGGLAFLVDIGQGLSAAGLMFGPGRWMVRFGIALNASVVLASVATRFVGNPGFLGFDRLPVEALNLTATAWQVAPLLLLFTIGREPGSARGGRRAS